MVTAVGLGRLKLKRLTDALGGQSEVARLLQVDRSRVSRWLKGDAPDPKNQESLDALEFVLGRLERSMAPSTARKWMTAVNAHLGNRRPIDLLAHHRIAEVIAAIEQDDLGSYA